MKQITTNTDREMKRDVFLKNVRKALRDKSHRNAESAFAPMVPDEDTYVGERDKTSLLQRLMEQEGESDLKVIPVKSADEAGEKIAELAARITPDPVDLLNPEKKQVVGWAHPLVDALGLEKRILDMGGAYVRTFWDHPEKADNAGKDEMQEKIIKSYIGVTSADYCVAETGTLVMKTAPDQPRSVSLAPGVHAAVITADQLIPDLRALYKIFRKELTADKNAFTRNMTFITGPSKTGDIELVMVHGAHGPREVYLYVIME